MTKRVLVALGLVLAACGDSDDSGNELGSANRLNAERVAADGGEYCCFTNGTATVDSPEVCHGPTSSCVWAEDTNDVDASGRGTMCGYLDCQ